MYSFSLIIFYRLSLYSILFASTVFLTSILLLFGVFLHNESTPFGLVTLEFENLTQQVLAAQTGVFVTTLLIFFTRYFTVIRFSKNDNHSFFIIVAVISVACIMSIVTHLIEFEGVTKDAFGYVFYIV